MRHTFLNTTILVLILLGISSCAQPGAEVGNRSQLIGHWHGDNNHTTAKQHVVFYDDDAGDGFSWGKQWNENELYESDLEYHGNGWFKWKKGDTYITMCHMMSASQAEPAKSHTLYVLTANSLEYQDTQQVRFYLTKVTQ